EQRSDRVFAGGALDLEAPADDRAGAEAGARSLRAHGGRRCHVRGRSYRSAGVGDNGYSGSSRGREGMRSAAKSGRIGEKPGRALENDPGVAEKAKGGEGEARRDDKKSERTDRKSSRLGPEARGSDKKSKRIDEKSGCVAPEQDPLCQKCVLVWPECLLVWQNCVSPRAEPALSHGELAGSAAARR